MPGEAGPLATAEGVTKTWPDGTRALFGVECALRPGAITALIGPNAAGKTTLLRILAGALDPSAGEVRVLGAKLGPGRLADRALKSRIGYIAQGTQLDPDMTGRETLTLFAALYGVDGSERATVVEAIGRAFGTEAHLDRRVKHYSGGLRRRLHIACGMVHDPELLLLDEPWAGLDPGSGALLWAELQRRAQRGTGVALITHDLGEVEQHADEVWILQGGELVARGAPSELTAEFDTPSITVTYGGASIEAGLVERALRGVPGVERVTAEGMRFTVTLAAGAQVEGRALAALGSVGREVLTVDVHRPDLVGALAARTGLDPAALEAPPTPGARGPGTGGGGGGGGRHR